MNQTTVGGTLSATVSHVNTIIRYTTVLALVLAAFVVLMVCGEGLCESCSHTCLSRVDRADRLRRTIARVLEKMTSAVRVVVSAQVMEPVRVFRALPLPGHSHVVLPAPLLI